jgi:hypothetical protein
LQPFAMQRRQETHDAPQCNGPFCCSVPSALSSPSAPSRSKRLRANKQTHCCRGEHACRQPAMTFGALRSLEPNMDEELKPASVT